MFCLELTREERDLLIQVLESTSAVVSIDGPIFQRL